MKKVAILLVVVTLLAVSVVPVMAKGGNGHGRGHGNGNGGQGNSAAGQHQTQNKQQDGDTKGFRGNRGNQGSARRNPFYLQGTILTVVPGTEVDTLLITVDVEHANSRAKQFMGLTEGMSIVVTLDTMIFKIDQTGGEEVGEGTAPTTSTNDENETLGNRAPITMGELNPGDIVAIHGSVVTTMVEDVTTDVANEVPSVEYVARLITVYLRIPVVPTEEPSP